MTKKKLWLVILAIMLVFGLMVVACQPEEEEEEPPPPPPKTPQEEVAAFVGTYAASYKSTSTITTDNVVETVVLTETSFVISDVTTGSATQDKLEFKIESWAFAATPSTYSTAYPNAFKFTGKITSSTSGYYSATSQTGKDIAATDIKADGSGTTCSMYLYFSGDGKFVRTPFTKSGATENVNIVLFYTTPIAGPDRVYTKK